MYEEKIWFGTSSNPEHQAGPRFIDSVPWQMLANNRDKSEASCQVGWHNKSNRVSFRLRVAIGREGAAHREYLERLVDLLASCAEGDVQYVESLCQTLMSPQELATTLNNK